MATPPTDGGLADHIGELISAIGPLLGSLIGSIAGLCLWAFRTQGKTIDNVITSMEQHRQEDDLCHDKLFDQQRETDAKLNNLIGEHNATHKGDK